MNGKDKYADIINVPYKKSISRAQITKENRAAQFAPFDALNGYSEAIKEVARVTEDRRENDEQRDFEINNTLCFLAENLSEKYVVKITCFTADICKSGGKFSDIVGAVKEVNTIKCILIMEDETRINFADISYIQVLNRIENGE